MAHQHGEHGGIDEAASSHGFDGVLADGAIDQYAAHHAELLPAEDEFGGLRILGVIPYCEEMALPQKRY